jgi:hypothetical protein
MVENKALVVYGGSSEDSEKLNDVWLFDFASKSWSMLRDNLESESETEPSGRSGHSIIHFKGHIVLFGGIFEITNELNDIFIFNLATKVWKVVEQNDKHAEQSSPLHKNRGSPRDSSSSPLSQKKRGQILNPEE